MPDTAKKIDLLTLGRVSLDLFSEQIGAPFPQIKSFAAGVGGSPTNIAIGTAVLGLKSAACTAVGADYVGKFIKNYLAKKGVDCSWVFTKPGKRTGMAILGIEPPDRFPLTFYREDPADIYLQPSDITQIDFQAIRGLLLSGTALSRGSSIQACWVAAEQASLKDTFIFLDLDLRPDQWEVFEEYGRSIRQMLTRVNCVVGTEEEFFSALAPNPTEWQPGAKLTSEQKIFLARNLPQQFARYPTLQALVLKKGDKGASLYLKSGGQKEIPGIPVQLVNTVGAGDAFASGLIYCWRLGKEWEDCVTFANRCGALMVTRNGCSEAMPTVEEVQRLLD